MNGMMIDAGLAAVIALCVLLLLGLGVACAGVALWIFERPRARMAGLLIAGIPLVAIPILFAWPVIGLRGVALVYGCLLVAFGPFAVLVVRRIVTLIDEPSIEL